MAFDERMDGAIGCGEDVAWEGIGHPRVRKSAMHDPTCGALTQTQSPQIDGHAIGRTHRNSLSKVIRNAVETEDGIDNLTQRREAPCKASHNYSMSNA